MKLKMTKEWLLKNIDKEDKAIVSAGSFCLGKLDALEELSKEKKEVDKPVPAFGRLINLSRRSKGLTMEKLAELARVDLDEILNIEETSEYTAEPRTVCQLAQVLQLPEDRVLELSGNRVARDKQLHEDAVKFAASAQSLEKLSPIEKQALEHFVQRLAMKK